MWMKVVLFVLLIASVRCVESTEDDVIQWLSEPQHYCGRRLTTVLKKACNPLIRNILAKDLTETMPAGSIIRQCCQNPCAARDILGYCPKHN